MSEGYPPGFCAIGASVRMQESDFRGIRNEHLQRAEFWHRKVKITVAQRLKHLAECPTCKGRSA